MNYDNILIDNLFGLFCIISVRRPKRHPVVRLKKQKLNVMIGFSERDDTMASWSDYKTHVRNTNPEIGKDIDEIEAVSQIVGVMIKRRHDLKLSQRDLASKIFRELGLNLIAEPGSPPAHPGR